MSEERRRKLEERVVWLEDSIAGLQKNYARTPKLAWLLLLVAPAWWLGGGLAAFYVAFMVLVFVGVTVYVAWSHLHENETELRAVQDELRRMGSRAEAPPTA